MCGLEQNSDTNSDCVLFVIVSNNQTKGKNAKKWQPTDVNQYHHCVIKSKHN
jgi:hypothetical protein